MMENGESEAERLEESLRRLADAIYPKVGRDEIERLPNVEPPNSRHSWWIAASSVAAVVAVIVALAVVDSGRPSETRIESRSDASGPSSEAPTSLPDGAGRTQANLRSTTTQDSESEPASDQGSDTVAPSTSSPLEPSSTLAPSTTPPVVTSTTVTTSTVTTTTTTADPSGATLSFAPAVAATGSLVDFSFEVSVMGGRTVMSDDVVLESADGHYIQVSLVFTDHPVASTKPFGIDDDGWPVTGSGKIAIPADASAGTYSVRFFDHAELTGTLIVEGE